MFSSILSLANFTIPRDVRTAFYKIGVNCLQGSHQGAQQSRRMTALADASMTSVIKDSVDTSCGFGSWFSTLPSVIISLIFLPIHHIILIDATFYIGF